MPNYSPGICVTYMNKEDEVQKDSVNDTILKAECLATKDIWEGKTKDKGT